MNEMIRIIAKPALLPLLMIFTLQLQAQDPAVLLQKVKSKMDQVQNYTASAKMKTDVSFMNVPVSDVNVYYKNPDQFKIKKTNGISMMPKGGVAINFSSLMTPGRYVAVPAADVTINGKVLKVIKLLPTDEKGDVILTTLFIDEKNLLINKAVTNTKDNGTYEMDLLYGRFAKWGLPDRVSIMFSTKDYKLPKGITFEYETDAKPVKGKDTDPGKGKVELTYTSYAINKGVPDNIFSSN